MIEIGGSEKTNRNGILSSNLLILVLTHMLVHAAGNIRSTLFPVLKAEFSLTYQQVGLIIAIPSIFQFLLSIPSGIISDKFGTKNIIALSIVIAAMGALLGSVSSTPWMFIVASTLLTLTTTIYHPASQSYVFNTTRPQDRTRVMGIFNSGGTAGTSLGPLSISILVGVLAFSWRQIYGFWIIPILLGLVALYFVKPATELLTKEVQEAWDEGETVETLLNSNMVFLLFSAAVRRFGGGLTTGFMSMWLAEVQGWTIGQIGMMLGVSSLIGIIANPLGGELASRYGEKRWFVMTLFGSYAFFALAFLVRGYWFFMIAYIIHSFFGTLGMPAHMTLIARLSPPHQKGVGFAFSSIPYNIVMPVSAMVAAYIADTYGLYPIFVITTVIYFIGLVILHLGVKVKD